MHHPAKTICLALTLVLCACPSVSPPQDNTTPMDMSLDGDMNAQPDEQSDTPSDISLDTSDALPDLVMPEMSEDMMSPQPPATLTRYITGNPSDADVAPKGPAWILMGGGPDVDEAFMWWKPLIHGGDVVVLRASGADGYNPYLYNDIGGVDSVETLIVDARTLADDPYVAQQVERAEGIFIAGGDQSKYLAFWQNTALQRALNAAHQRGAVIGGTSAGCAILGEFIYSAQNGTVYADEALANPYDSRMTFAQAFVQSTMTKNMITDTHFYARDRMGRLIAFVARTKQDHPDSAPMGLGVDEGTALVIDATGLATVMGDGYVYVVDGSNAAEQCEANQPLSYTNVPYIRLDAGQQFRLDAPPAYDRTLTAKDGKLVADDLY